MIEHKNIKDEVVSNHRRITEPSKTVDKHLLSWFEHFENLNIPCAIVKVNDRYVLYALEQIKVGQLCSFSGKLLSVYPETQEQLEKTDEIVKQHDYFHMRANRV